MIDFAFAPDTFRRPEPDHARPPLRPAWLYPSSAALVVSAHLIFFAAFMNLVEPRLIALDSIDAELVRDGDFLDSGASVGADFQGEEAAAQIRPEEVADLPPPPIMEPVDVSAAARDQPVAERRAPTQKSRPAKMAGRQDAAARMSGRGAGGSGNGAGSGRSPGVPGGRGVGAGASQATCLAGVAASIHSHTPGATSLGPGSAYVTFHVNAGGGVSGVSATGTTPAHAALARRIVASSHGPALCAAAFASQNISFE